MSGGKIGICLYVFCDFYNFYDFPKIRIFLEKFFSFILKKDSHNNIANAKQKYKKEKKTMASKSGKIVVPEAREALDRFKMEAASEVGVNLKNGYNGDITARQAGSIGGQMVKKMIESYEKGLK